MVTLSTLDKVCGKYIDLFDGYDSDKHSVQYFGRANLTLERNIDGELIFKVEIYIKEKTTLIRFSQFISELSNSLEKIMEEAEEMLSTP